MHRRTVVIFAIAFVFVIGGIVKQPASAHAGSAVTAIYSFQGESDGFSPQNLVFGAYGFLYGTTNQGGNSRNCFLGCGTVFQLKPGRSGGPWVKTTIHQFAANGADGYNPTPTLIADSHGNLFGTTYFGGSSNAGTVYELSPPTARGGRWKETFLYQFNFNNHGVAGYTPGALIPDGQGDFFGTTYGGGKYDGGTIIELTSNGGSWNETVLHSFDRQANDDPPNGSLTFDRYGNLYGTRAGMFGVCNFDNPVFCGVLYQFHKPYKLGGPWIYNVLHRFEGSADGWFPNLTLLIDPTFGYVFGTASQGGSVGWGAVFEFVPPPPGSHDWAEYFPHGFGQQSGDGLTPLGSVTFGPSGKLFGSTSAVSGSGNGSVYELDPPSLNGGSWTETVLTNFPDLSQGSEPNGDLVWGKDGALYGTTIQGGTGNCTFDQLSGCGVVFRIVR